MNDKISCSIVQDLLPNYIEKLTSNETNHIIEQHLAICEDCKKANEQMNSEIQSTVKVPVIELKFLRKVKRTRLLAAVLTIILALNFSYMVYTTEFKYANDKNALAVGITEFLSKNSINAYVLETKEVDGRLIATFKDQSKTNVNGVAVFAKGFNEKYRIISAKINDSDYSSVIQIFSIEIKDEDYYVVSGYNLSDKIKYYGLDYIYYKNEGEFSKHTVSIPVKFEIKNQQFLEVYRADEIDKLSEDSIQHELYISRVISSSLYDIDGTEITENFKVNEYASNSIIANTYKTELSNIYISVWAVLELGIILMIFFLT